MQRFLTPIIAVLVGVACVTGSAATTAPVTVTENLQNDTYTLSNGLVTAVITKRSGSIASLVYNGIETLNNGGNVDRPQGNWSHSAWSNDTTARIAIDPKTNGGDLAEVSVKGISGGRPMGAGPGGSVIADIEIRYTMVRGVSGIYTYCIFDHPPQYPATGMGEARFYVKLNDAVFDWMTVDRNRNMKMITASDWNHGTVMNMKEARLMNTGIDKGQVEHKYDYSANQFETLAWGWSSTTKHIGFWFVNPTIEYLSGGPTKIELSAHRDATFNVGPAYYDAPAPPCLLNYWRSSHYGGSSISVAQGEHWNKVVGPFLVYCNAGDSPDAMWKDALARSEVETRAWPYDWVKGVDYPHKNERATVTGKLQLDDPQSTQKDLPHLLVGLTWPDYTVNGGRFGPNKIDWQTDAKHYEFWTRGEADGRFAIRNVRPGTYTLHAIADGVLGEYAQANITVKEGQSLDLGQLQWKPVRYGKQLWDIGIPNRSAKEFRHGDDYFHWGLYLQYPREFPDDVNFTIGQSDFSKDWNHIHVPRATDDVGKSPGKAATWTVHFDVPQQPKGKAILRLALCGSSGTTVFVNVNGKPAGDTGRLPYNATINRDAIAGNWFERDVTFDASLMKPGANTLQLTVPAGGVTNGVVYDYVRLELDENATATPTTMR